MRLSRSFGAALTVILPLAALSSAERIFQSTSLESCQDNSTITASLFNVAFTPQNQSLSLKFQGQSTHAGNVTFNVTASAYGYTFLKTNLDPCTYAGLTTLCPLDHIEIAFDEKFENISTSVIGDIPGIAFTIPDLDAVVEINMFARGDSRDQSHRLGCVRLRLSNGKTVNQTGVKWATAAIAIIGLLASAIVSGLGHTNTAAHVSLYATALFSYFQNIAIIGLCAIPLPPIVQSWTQDFVWSVGIIRVGFLQNFAMWYQRATGGKPTSILQTLVSKSVQVAKRGLDTHRENFIVEKSLAIVKRAQEVTTTAGGAYIVTGLQRAAFLAPMEPSNLYVTCITFYFIFCLFTLFVISLFKVLCDLAIKLNWMQSQNNRFRDFQDNWRIMLKGTIFRLILIGYAPMMILSLWEFTVVDSPAEVFLAVIFFIGMNGALFLAAFHVMTIARRSGHKHQTPAYLLYTNPTTLKKWGFLFIQFRASAYWYIAPTLFYILLKSFFVGLAQGSGLTQAIVLVIIEAAALIGVSVIRPYMDKTSNSMHIAICVVQFLNAVFLLIFTDVFDGPGLLIGVASLIFFFVNIIFVFVILIIVLVASTMSIVRKDPETRYQPMGDNRGSFIKSQTTLTAELDMLAATAREAGDGEGGYSKEMDVRGMSASPVSRVSRVSRIDTDRGSNLRDSSLSPSSYGGHEDQGGWRPPVPTHQTALTPRASMGSERLSVRSRQR
ncbi:related to Calcium_related spray protein [Rhynchosporium secalis]|uniref:Related to Calcium_related spray protein n=1 Tax=Rhynchosporium secalis TaxID=38038 RepID=A0A1E1M295_RHYSE|nr:related to Calcium_related spray protein [Rhynchosporium secalis]